MAGANTSNNRRYAAMLFFQFRVVTEGVAKKRRLCEKRLIVFRAANGRAAVREAKRRGRQAQHNYLGARGGRVYFEFVGVLDLLHLGPECDDDEVWYEFHRLQEPMERREQLLPPESELPSNAEC